MKTYNRRNKVIPGEQTCKAFSSSFVFDKVKNTTAPASWGLFQSVIAFNLINAFYSDWPWHSFIGR